MKRPALTAALICGLAAAGQAMSGCGSSGGDEAGAGASAASRDSALHTLHFEVSGMHCQGCVQSIEQAVTKMEGIGKCTVSLTDGTATVTTRMPQDSDAIAAAIRALGFGVEQRMP